MTPEQPGGSPGAGCAVRVIESPEDLCDAYGEWEALWEECENRSPFLSFDWVKSWAETRGVGTPLHIVVVRRGEHTIAIIPLAVVSHSIGPVTVTALETAAGDSRNMIALVRPGREHAAARAFLDHLGRLASTKSTCLRLQLVPSDAPFLSELRRIVTKQGGVDMLVRESSRAPYVCLPAEWEQLWRTLSGSRRKLLRRLKRRLESEHIVVFEDCHRGDVPVALEQLFDLHQGRWSASGIRGLFGQQSYRDFHARVCLRLDERGWLYLTRMIIDDEVVSVHLTVTLDGVLYLLRTGRALKYLDYSIGHLHDLHMLQSAIESGMQETDFLRGAEPYKFYWTYRQRIYVDVVAAVGGWSRLRAPALAVFLRVAAFLEHDHSPRELVAILRMRRKRARELDSMRRGRLRGKI